MKALSSDAVSVAEDGDITIRAEALAPLLQVATEDLKHAMRAGQVASLVEHGEDDDAGRLRLTFRYGERVLSLMREPDGSLAETQPPPPEQYPVRPSLMRLLD